MSSAHIKDSFGFVLGFVAFILLFCIDFLSKSEFRFVYFKLFALKHDVFVYGEGDYYVEFSFEFVSAFSNLIVCKGIIFFFEKFYLIILLLWLCLWRLMKMVIIYFCAFLIFFFLRNIQSVHIVTKKVACFGCLRLPTAQNNVLVYEEDFHF